MTSASGFAATVQDAGGLMTAANLAGYRGRIERPTRLTVKLGERTYDSLQDGLLGTDPVLLQALRLLEGFDLARMGHDSTEYIHTVTEALKLALADRDELYGDPDFALRARSRGPRTGVCRRAAEAASTPSGRTGRQESGKSMEVRARRRGTTGPDRDPSVPRR